MRGGFHEVAFLGFDVFGTVVDWRTGVARAAAPFLARHGIAAVNLARYAGLPWDAILGAEIAHGYKPQPEVYLKSVEAAGVAPAQAAMVAAHNRDLETARALGLRTIFVRRPLEHGPGQASDLQPSQDWDVVADSLVEVADILGCP
jgi:2-haloacid dehalogenase